ncbi:hypothetical protein SPB21_12325 [Leptothoe sp. ISB3NOV94-8A]
MSNWTEFEAEFKIDYLVRRIEHYITERGNSRRTNADITCFLSHSGDDAKEVTQFARALEVDMRALGIEVEVFNTSDPRYRFDEFKGYRFDESKDFLKMGDALQEILTRPLDALAQYLADNLIGSRFYLLYVTENSIAKRSAWITFEIHMARRLAIQSLEGKPLAFIPCVTASSSFAKLPKLAISFQGIDLASEPKKLSQEMARILSHDT